MVEFPRNTVISIPAGLRLPGGCGVAARIEGPSEAIAAKEFYGERLREVVIHAAAMGADADLSPLAGLRVRIVGMALLDLELGSRIAGGARMRLVFELNPSGQFPRLLNFLAGFDFPVHVRAAHPDPDPGLLLGALERFLRGPLQNAPIEPFATLLRTGADGRGRTLWDTEREQPGSRFHVADDGAIALSERWAAAGRSVGRLEETWAVMERSPEFACMAALRGAVLRDGGACMLCEHAPLCGGYLKAVDAGLDCEGWKRVFAALRVEVERIRALVKQYGGKRNTV